MNTSRIQDIAIINLPVSIMQLLTNMQDIIIILANL